MKSCELCKSQAKIYCDSDQASLCWTCDTKVHSANFLVARHSRNLLCRHCHTPTPWTAAGDKLPPSAVTICDKCSADAASGDDRDESEDEYYRNDDGYDEDGETELDEDEDEDEDVDDNQVVPLTYTPPPAASSSSSDDYYSVDDLLKRKRVNDTHLCEDDAECLSGRKKVVRLADSGEEVEGNKGTLFNFISLSSERMGEKKSGEVTGECKGTRTVGFDLNSSDS